MQRSLKRGLIRQLAYKRATQGKLAIDLLNHANTTGIRLNGVPITQITLDRTADDGSTQLIRSAFQIEHILIGCAEHGTYLNENGSRVFLPSCNGSSTEHASPTRQGKSTSHGGIAWSHTIVGFGSAEGDERVGTVGNKHGLSIGMATYKHRNIGTCHSGRDEILLTEVAHRNLHIHLIVI